MVLEGLGPYNDVSPAFENNQFGPRVHNTSKNARTQKPKNMGTQNPKLQEHKITEIHKHINAFSSIFEKTRHGHY